MTHTHLSSLADLLADDSPVAAEPFTGGDPLKRRSDSAGECGETDQVRFGETDLHATGETDQVRFGKTDATHSEPAGECGEAAGARNCNCAKQAWERRMRCRMQL